MNKHEHKPHTLTFGDGIRVRASGVTRSGGVVLMNISDIEDEDGTTIKERNMKLGHAIELGALVELQSGVRLFVVHQGRDCDKSPLYWLSPTPEPLYFNNDIYERHIIRECLRRQVEGGYADRELTVIAGPERAYAELERKGYYEDGKWLESPYFDYRK